VSNDQNPPNSNKAIAWETKSGIYRLCFVLAIIFLNIAVVASLLVIKPELGGADLPLPDKGSEDVFRGISPAIRACYSTHSKISAVIIASLFGMSLGLAYYFGSYIFRRFRETSMGDMGERNAFWTSVARHISQLPTSSIQEELLGFVEFEKAILDRRNQFWGLYLRVTVAILVICLIALLITLCKIEAQAGLPIITAIIAFVIGQGSDAGRSLSSPLVLRGPDRGPASKSNGSTIPNRARKVGRVAREVPLIFSRYIFWQPGRP
jgi:hypothetical protein